MVDVNYSRQYKLFDPTKEAKPIRIFGCGSIGSILAYMLAKVGFKQIEVIDFDIVEIDNITPQMFSLKDLDKQKVTAIYEKIKEDLGTEISIVDGKIDNDTEFEYDDYISILAFDSLKGRQLIYDKIKDFKGQFIDVRAGGKNYELWVVDLKNEEPKFIAQYEKSLQREPADLVCGEKTAFYINCNICSEVVSQLIKLCKDVDYQCHIIRNIDDFEFIYKTKQKNKQDQPKTTNQ
jgi:tRNA A37 threonylcarbamoyladenosine dehydratase